ncbi:hypothetical protein MRX96_008451 [Rhipicephalus microplus]
MVYAKRSAAIVRTDAPRATLAYFPFYIRRSLGGGTATVTASIPRTSATSGVGHCEREALVIIAASFNIGFNSRMLLHSQHQSRAGFPPGSKRRSNHFGRVHWAHHDCAAIGFRLQDSVSFIISFAHVNEMYEEHCILRNGHAQCCRTTAPLCTTPCQACSTPDRVSLVDIVSTLSASFNSSMVATHKPALPFVSGLCLLCGKENPPGTQGPAATAIPRVLASCLPYGECTTEETPLL